MTPLGMAVGVMALPSVPLTCAPTLRGVCSLNLGYLNLFVLSFLPVLPSSSCVPCLGKWDLCPLPVGSGKQ